LSRGPDGGELVGALLLDKPGGLTSHDLVQVVRRTAGQRSVGHVGTLDPLATGLMVLLLGWATKLGPWLVGHDKSYEGSAQLGLITDTDDSAGRVLSESQGPWPSTAELTEALKSFEGPLRQRPPAFSAVKVAGRPAYASARQGRPLDLPPRPVTARRLELLDWRPPTLKMRLEVSSGFYVRSLARDLGHRLGLGGGALTALRRLACGPFRLEAATPLPPRTAERGDADARERLRAALLSPRAALAHLEELELPAAPAKKLRSGGFVALPDGLERLLERPPDRLSAELVDGLAEDGGPSDVRLSGPLKIIGPSGELTALAEIFFGPSGSSTPQRPCLRPLRVFAPA
jgi:tRNA pseudouridine55 synthase